MIESQSGLKPSSNVRARLIVEVDGVETCRGELGSDSIASIINRLTNENEHVSRDLLTAFAQSPSNEIRYQVACQSGLSLEAVELLAHDSQANVLRALCGNEAFHKWASTDLLIDRFLTDVECADQIVRHLEDFSVADVDTIAAALSQHPDPSVRAALAGNWRAPKRFVRLLLDDPDISVRAAARATLKE